MLKVQIMLACTSCNGKAYLFDRKALSYSGEEYDRYRACWSCLGSGTQTQWVSLEAFARMLEGGQISQSSKKPNGKLPV